jgi:hypothetical protein
MLFALLAQPVAASQPTKSVVYKIEETHRLPNYSTNDAKDVVATILLFDNRSGWANQQVLSEHISVDGALISPNISRTEDNRIARISLGTISSGSSKTITIVQIIKVDHVEPIDPNSVGESIPAELLVYTKPVPYLWESDNQVLFNKAIRLTAGEPNLYYKARKIFDFVNGYLTYEEQVEEHSAVWAYDHRRGDCTEFTNLFIALCRAAGIPAKFVSGYGYRPETEDLELMAHAFALIYLPNVGWVPVDLTWSRPKGEFCELSKDHLVQLISDGRNLMQDGWIVIPGNRVKYKYDLPGPNPELNFESISKITREVAIEPKLAAAARMEDSMWRFSVRVKNVGSQAVTNVRVKLQADENYFEVPPAETIDGLAAGVQQTVSFDIGVKSDVENSPLKAIVTYDSPYGTFLAEDQMSVSASISAPEIPIPEEIIEALPLILIVAIAGIAVAIAAALLRRR